jgi:hypothetical protein
MDKEQPPLTPPEGGECCAQTLLFNGYYFYLSVKGFQILNNKKKVTGIHISSPPGEREGTKNFYIERRTKNSSR